MTTTIVAVAPTNVVVVPDPCLEDGEWWKTDGVEDENVIAAYAAKGAASYSASKTNLANPETYDLIDTGHAPDWDSTNGWKFASASSEYLDTGIEPASSWSMICKFDNLTNNGYLCGVQNGNVAHFAIQPNTGVGRGYYLGNSATSVTGIIDSGIIGAAQYQGYLDGAPDGDPVDASAWSDTGASLNICIGCVDFAGDSPSNFISVYVKAFAVYNKTLTQSQIQAIGNAMP